jgi:hypothetical protein
LAVALALEEEGGGEGALAQTGLRCPLALCSPPTTRAVWP